MSKKRLRLMTALLLLYPLTAAALDYPYQTAEPQTTGWPLTNEEWAYVLKPEYERRPGRASNKHLLAMGQLARHQAAEHRVAETVR